MDGKHILLVDDDEDLVQAYRYILEVEGYLVESALTGKQAIEMAEKKIFDLAILDIVLPDIRGDDVARELKKMNHAMGMVLITGFPSFQECIDALDLGIHEILLKPIHPKELLRVIAEALNRG